ncbi:head GIN domain-containing protein [uncultured Draconibacterium sp.]|uniref:head GIN domain-containing protein n=1 Tax=uncultured Draconibacterium sp. TaxID=1573823 RepID=UPI003216B2A6
MKTFKLLILASFALLTGVTSCVKDSVMGNGNLASEERISASFNKVHSAGEFDVYITQGDNYEVVISAEENVIPFIETSFRNGVLTVETETLTSIRNTLPMEIFITTPNLEGIKLSGSGLISTDFFDCDKMDILLSGSGRINTTVSTNKVEALVSGSGVIDLSGTTTDADFGISGSGKIKASDLAVVHCSTATSGSGDMWVSVDNTLKAHISGSGNVFYYGSPDVETHISGSGNVIDYN